MNLLSLVAKMVRLFPGGKWILQWVDPLSGSRVPLEEALVQRTGQLSGNVVDIGCGIQRYRHLLGHVDRYWGLDVPPRGKVDVYGDALALPFGDGVFDSAICNEVLEHVPEPLQLLTEAARALRPGGTLLLTAPQTWGLHLEPFDFYRYTSYGLRYLAEKAGFEVKEICPTSGIWGTTTQRLADTIVNTYAVRWPPRLVKVLSLALMPVLLAGYGLDRLLGKRGDTLDYVMVARKLP